MSEVTLTIDGRPVTVAAETTLLQAAAQLQIEIPTICYHEACTPNALCRMCVVEVEKQRLLQPACVAQVREGMVVQTRSERVERSRRTLLELLDSAVDLSDAPDIQLQLAADFYALFQGIIGSSRRGYDRYGIHSRTLPQMRG